MRTSFLRVGAGVLACTFPRPFVVVDYNQFTQQGGRAQIKTIPEVSCIQEDSRLVTMSHIFCDIFQCSRMLRTVEHFFLLVSSIFSMAQGGYVDFVTCAH